MHNSLKTIVLNSSSQFNVMVLRYSLMKKAFFSDHEVFTSISLIYNIIKTFILVVSYSKLVVMLIIFILIEFQIIHAFLAFPFFCSKNDEFLVFIIFSGVSDYELKSK